jgi:PIN domain nuclease of toxin-antitoxin system
MRILVDTHILVWMHTFDRRLSSKAIDFIMDPNNSIYYSAVSIWESEMKYNLHPEDFPFSGRELNALSEKANLNCLLLEPEHTFALGSLVYSEKAPQKHKDPFDKILICQAKVEDMLFLTHDHLIPYYNESCVVSV